MKLRLVVPGPTEGTRLSRFGDVGALLEPPTFDPSGRATFTGPELACTQTAPGVVLDGLRGPDFGRWAGLTLEEVLGRDVSGLQRWLADPSTAPHGGESLAAHRARVGDLLDAGDWPDSGAVVVASAFTVRAACTHALGAPDASLMNLDVAPHARATISRNGARWRLQALVPPGA